MKIYHNPRCRKSREALKIIQDAGREVEIIEYLKDPPSVEELRKMVNMLGMKPFDLIRKGEDIFKKQFKHQTLSDREWLEVMVQNPNLIERPVVVAGDRAVLGRPPEKVSALF